MDRESSIDAFLFGTADAPVEDALPESAPEVDRETSIDAFLFGSETEKAPPPKASFGDMSPGSSFFGGVDIAAGALKEAGASISQEPSPEARESARLIMERGGNVHENRALAEEVLRKSVAHEASRNPTVIAGREQAALGKQVSDLYNPPPEQMSLAQRGTKMFLENAAPMVAGTAASVATRSLTPGLAIASSVSAASSFNQCIAKTGDRAFCGMLATANGGVEAATEALPLHYVLKLAGAKKGWFRTLISLYGTELAGEQLANAGQSALQASYDPKMTFGEWLRSVPEVAVASAIGATVAGGGALAIGAATGKDIHASDLDDETPAEQPPKPDVRPEKPPVAEDEGGVDVGPRIPPKPPVEEKPPVEQPTEQPVETPPGPVVETPTPPTPVETAPVETPVEAKPPGTRVEIGRGGAGITAEPVNLPPVIDVERRKNTARRKKLDEMTPQELREELRVDRPTGMMTRRALEEDGYRKAVASVDVDGLKRVNDTIGHIAGDELLKRVADELRRSGLKPYRTGGDEIQITSDDPKRLQHALDGALKRLAGVKIQNGPLANTGISFTYGVADNFESADQIAIQNKTAKKAAGIIPTRKGEAITLTEGEKRTEAATPQQTEKPKAPAQKEPKPTKKAQKSKKAAQVKQPESEPQAASDAAFDLGGTPAAAQATGPKGEPLVVRSRQKAPGKPGEKRGVGHIMSVLHKAATKGIINESEARFVSWFLKKNEALVSDLEARTTRRGGGAEAGWYKPAERLMLIIGNSKEGLTAVHEILHHLERMMPSSMQDAIRTEWQKQVEAKLAGGTLNQAEQDYMRAVLDAWNGDPKARRHAYNLLVSGQVDIPKFYRYFNPSEFFAVNGSELMQRRYQSSGNIWSRIHNWMKEAVEHMKRWLGNRNASIALKAIDALVNGGAGGKIPKGRKMLSQQPGAAYGMLRTGPRLLYRILRVPVSPSIVAKLYPEFAPVWRMGEAAQQNEEVISKLFHRRLKAVGEALERSGNRDANVETLTDAMFMEDILQREFTDQELTNAGVTGNVRTAYILLRSAYKQAIRMTNRVRALEGLPPVTERAGYVPRVFHNWRIRSASGENLATAETLAEAIKIAKTYPDPQNLLISPGAYQNQIPGQYAVALGDKEFTRALLKLAEAQGITVDEAADMLRGVQTPSRKNRAFAHFKKRTGVSGYSEDLLAVSRGYFDGIARYAAMAPFKKRARSYFERHPDFGEFDNEKWPNDESGIGPYIKDYISRVNGDIGKVEQYLNSAIAKHPLLSQYFGERSSREIASAITTGVSIVKLGFFAPLSMLVNLTQYNNIRGLIGDRSAAAGAVRASVVLAELMRRRFVTKSSKHRSGDIGIVERSGVLLQQSLDGMDVYGGKKTGISKAAKAARATLAGFHGVELWLRMTAVLGAHHKAIKDGKSRQQAIAEAQEINRLANFNNGVADTPEIISALGPVGSVVGQFKKFPIKQAELLAGMSGMEHVRWWIPFIIASGLFNLPGDELLRKLFEWATGKDYEVEAKKVLDELVEEGELPESVADTAKYGIAAPVADIDLSRRVGQGDIIPTRLSDIPGPFLGTFWRAVQQAAEGNWIETIKQIAPFPGNVLEQETTNGDLESVWNRDRLVTTLTPSEKAVKAIGGQPVRVSKIKDAERAAAYQARLERDVRTRIIDNILDLEERLDSADDPDAIQDKIDALYDEAEEKNVRITATMLKNARDARETPAAERIRDRVSPEVEEELEATINAVEEDELETDEELENGR